MAQTGSETYCVTEQSISELASSSECLTSSTGCHSLLLLEAFKCSVLRDLPLQVGSYCSDLAESLPASKSLRDTPGDAVQQIMTNVEKKWRR